MEWVKCPPEHVFSVKVYVLQVNIFWKKRYRRMFTEKTFSGERKITYENIMISKNFFQKIKNNLRKIFFCKSLFEKRFSKLRKI